MRSILRVGAAVAVLTGVTAAAAAKHHQLGGGALRGPYRSPPGWFGPGPAWHHWSDPGPGLDWRYHGVPDGPFVTVPSDPRARRGFAPGFWGIPGAAGSFWTNGLSLYGPPIPTYGPIPGVFSGGDAGKHFFHNPPPANGVWFGLGWGGYRSPSPRKGPLSVSVHPAPAVGPSVQVIPAQPAVTPAGEPCLRLAVRLPEPDANLWIERTEMTQKGTDRTFESPPLEAGRTYRYDVVARWTADGREKAESRTVTGQPGQTISIDFTKPADEPGVAQK